MQEDWFDPQHYQEWFPGRNGNIYSRGITGDEKMLQD